MARQMTNSSNNEWTRITDGVSVKHTKDSGFSLNWFGAVIHGCRIVKGANGPFISWPSFRGKDDKYIKRAYVYAERGSQDEKILAEVVNVLTR